MFINRAALIFGVTCAALTVAHHSQAEELPEPSFSETAREIVDEMTAAGELGVGQDGSRFEEFAREVSEDAIRRKREERQGFLKGEPVLGGAFAEQVKAEVSRQEEIERVSSRRDRIGFRVLVTSAMPESELRAIADEARLRGDTALVFRGFRDGDRFPEFQRWLFDVFDEKAVPVEIDPTLFREHGAEVAPAIVKLETGAIVYGLSVVGDFDAVVARGLETVGPTVEIVEPDLISVMQARLAKLDLVEKGRKSAETYWERASFVDLPLVTRSRLRAVDPTVVSRADILDSFGNVLAPKGAKVNPLSVLPSSLSFAVIDGRSSYQIEWAAELPPRTIVLLSNMDRGLGWAAFKDVELRTGKRVYLLTEDVARRFSIWAAPTWVKADGLRFLVEEVSLIDEVLGQAN